MKKWLLAFLLLYHPSLSAAFPVPALAASRRGLNLWFGTLVPTLLPFLILSGPLIHTGLVHIPASLLAPVFGRLFGVSPLGSYACFIGFLCGFPMGAKVLADLTRNGRMPPLRKPLIFWALLTTVEPFLRHHLSGDGEV